jgi:hypothetical protein
MKRNDGGKLTKDQGTGGQLTDAVSEKKPCDGKQRPRRYVGRRMTDLAVEKQLAACHKAPEIVRHL